jgi:signal transduction histidine kinase
MSSRLTGAFLTLVVLVLIVLELPLAATFANQEHDQLRTQIERDAVVMGTFVEDALQNGGALDRSVVDRFVERTGARVVIVDQQGVAVIDTDPPNDGTRSFASRPEIAAALRGRVAAGTRRSATLDGRFVYVAVPVASAGTVYGAVRVTVSTSEVDERVRSYWLRLAGVAAVSLAGAGIVAALLSRSVSRPLERLERTAAAMAGGDLSARVSSDAGPPVVRRLARTFDDMAGRMEELVTAQDAFVADASHQLRNPLAALRLRIENLGAEATPEAQDDISGALREIERLSRLVDGLLALARADRDAGTPPARAVDLVALLHQRRAVWAPLAEERGLSIQVQPDDEQAAIPAFVTPDRFEQIIDNLLANALESSPHGSTVVVSAELDHREVVVRVVDAGPGMTADDRAHAFDRFWSGRGSRSLGGSGLGLSIVQKLVAADGGAITLEVGPAGGLAVVLRLRSREDSRPS